MEIELLSCPLCLKPHFDGVDALRSTLISVATSSLSCPVCSESLLGLDKLTIHLFGHIPMNRQEMSNTNTTVANTDIEENGNKTSESLFCINSNDQIEPSLINNGTVTTNDCDNSVRCDICNFCFIDNSVLDIHKKLLHEISLDVKSNCYNYHCHLCTKKFKMRGSLMVHFRVAHYGFERQNGAAPITLPSSDITNNETGNKNNVHTELQQDNMQLNFEVLNSKKNQSIKISDNKQWKCDTCSKMFTTKYFLKKHKRLHTGEMPYNCLQCNKSFTFQQSYHKHMLYHSSEKPHVCNECGRAFKELSTLHNHERIHSGERPFPCETCGKCFRQRVSYLVHRRIHTGVMPYKCTACDKSFRYKVSQRSHKCLMNPPGSVIKVPNLIEKLSLKFVESSNTNATFNSEYIINKLTENMATLNPDSEYENIALSAGNRNTELTSEQMQTTVADNKDSHLNCLNDSSNQDFFSMVLSPLQPEIQSLYLLNPENSEHLKNITHKKADKSTEFCKTVNEESFREMLYGSSH